MYCIVWIIEPRPVQHGAVRCMGISDMRAPFAPLEMCCAGGRIVGCGWRWEVRSRKDSQVRPPLPNQPLSILLGLVGSVRPSLSIDHPSRPPASLSAFAHFPGILHMDMLDGMGMDMEHGDTEAWGHGIVQGRREGKGMEGKCDLRCELFPPHPPQLDILLACCDSESRFGRMRDMIGVLGDGLYMDS